MMKKIFDSTIQPLQIAVRRRLWRGEFIAFARTALWGSVALMLLAVAVHLATRPVHVDAVLLSVAALWASMMVWAGLRRPSDSACALWADRHLGGESAYSTLLEMREGRQTAPNAQAMQWLEHWAVARVPHSLRLLGGHVESARLSRPLLSMLVCTALATIVLMLPGTAPTARQEFAAPSPSGGADRPMPDAGRRPASTELADALASALRSAESRPATDRRDDGRGTTAGPGKGDAATAFRSAPPGVAPKGNESATGGSLPRTGDDAAPTAAKGQASDVGSGRGAGDSPDNRVDAGVSQVMGGTIEAKRRESSESRTSRERQADVDQVATFDDEVPMHRTAMEQRVSAVAAATPPPAADAAPLSPTRAAYVQAWMKARSPRR